MVRASEPVTAAGTSEGVKKSWESRARSAYEAGSTAYKHSFRALTPSDHNVAANAHKLAAEAHDHAAEIAEDPTDTHLKKAAEHRQEMKHHLKMAKPTQASSTEEEKNIVSARSVVSCRAGGNPLSSKKVWAVDQEVDFMWMPGGVHTIHASYGRADSDQRPIELTVACTKDGAQAVQSAFEAIRAASPRRPPFICIEHTAKERAGEPVGFEWRDVPEPAIYCRCQPSALGCNNVNGKIHTSFSPTFDTDAQYHLMHCTDCEERPATCKCTGQDAAWYFPPGVRGSPSNPAQVTAPDVQSVGSLTNWNAFKEMRPVAARGTGEVEKKVEAAGTSEGARKGWEDRRSLANQAGTESEAASTKAQNTGNKSDHFEAMLAHRKASDLHLNASGAALNAGHTTAFHHHVALSDHHERMAVDHMNNADELKTAKSSSTEKGKEVIQAKEEEKPTVDSILASAAPAESVDVLLQRNWLASMWGGEGKVKAAGTSEGARKAAATKREAGRASAHAMILTQEADAASRIAIASKLNSHHQEAADKHQEADDAHLAAAKASRLAGDERGWRQHHDYAEHHNHSWGVHNDRATTKASSTKEEKEVIQAKEEMTSDKILARMGQTGRPPATTNEGINE